MQKPSILAIIQYECLNKCWLPAWGLPLFCLNLIFEHSITQDKEILQDRRSTLPFTNRGPEEGKYINDSTLNIKVKAEVIISDGYKKSRPENTSLGSLQNVTLSTKNKWGFAPCLLMVIGNKTQKQKMTILSSFFDYSKVKWNSGDHT